MFGSPRKGRQPGDEVVHQGDYNRGRDPLTLSRWPARLWLARPPLHYFSSHHAPSARPLFLFLHRQLQPSQNSKASGAAQPSIYFRVV